MQSNTHGNDNSLNNDFFDIVVLGGGLVGLSYAIAQCQTSSLHPLKIAIIDKQILNPEKRKDGRAIALSYSSWGLLQKLGGWESVAKDATFIHEVHVSAKGQFGVTKLVSGMSEISTTHQTKALGVVVDADSLLQGLLFFAKTFSNITFFQPDEVSRAEGIDAEVMTAEHDLLPNKTFHWKLTLASGETLFTKLLVGADGTHSFIRKRFGIEVHREDYQQVALVANINLQEDHFHIAYERFLPNMKDYGSIALLPFGAHCVKSILIVQQALLNQMLALSDKAYLACLQEAFGFRLGKFIGLGERYHYPLQGITTKALYGTGWVLLGNAANTLHPLAAQGFNLGLRDAITLANIVSETLIQREDIHQAIVLQRYANARQKDHFHTQSFTNMLLKQKSLISWGILGCEFLPFMKDKVIQQGLRTA